MKVKLLKPHEHQGRRRLPGDILDLDESTAQWLIDIGVAEAAPNRKPKTTGD